MKASVELTKDPEAKELVLATRTQYSPSEGCYTPYERPQAEAMEPETALDLQLNPTPQKAPSTISVPRT